MKTVLTVLLVIGIAGQAAGAVVTFQFSGTIGHAFSIFGDDVHVGDPFVATFSFENTTPDAVATVGWGGYPQQAGFGITVKAGNATFFSSANPADAYNQGGLIFDVLPASSGHSEIFVQSGLGSTVDPRIIILFVVPFDGVGLPTEELPTSIDPAAWESAAMFIQGPTPGPRGESVTIDVSGEITSFSVVVPEARSITIWSVFVALGLVAVSLSRGRFQAAQ